MSARYYIAYLQLCPPCPAHVFLTILHPSSITTLSAFIVNTTCSPSYLPSMDFNAYDPFALEFSNRRIAPAAQSSEEQNATMAVQTMEWAPADAWRLDSHQAADLNANDPSPLGPTNWVVAPAAPSSGEQPANMMALQTIEEPLSEAQSLGSHPIAGWTPNLDLAELDPVAPAMPTTHHSSTLQQLAPSHKSDTPIEKARDPSQQPVVKQTGWIPEPAEEDWKQVRPRITELYRDLKYPLAKVMKTVRREHDFKATYDHHEISLETGG